MKAGNVNCSCGQSFHVQSVSDSVSCIRCAKVHDISGFPEEVATIEEQPTEVEFTEELADSVDEVPPVVEEPQNGSEGV